MKTLIVAIALLSGPALAIAEPNCADVGNTAASNCGTLLPVSPLAPSLVLHALVADRVTWQAVGNHPNHKWVELKAANEPLLVVHQDNTYGVLSTDWTLNLMTSVLTKTAVVRGEHGEPVQVVESYVPAQVRQYSEELDQMRREVEVIRLGFGDDTGPAQPAHPELDELGYFLRVALRREVSCHGEPC
jgi:hypothetical protein